MAIWSPDQYLKFADHRRRPAVDLLARVALDAPRSVIDLGCGAGNVTRLLHDRWPQARLIGVDFSAAMLEKARAVLPEAEWVEADLGAWIPAAPPDLIFSNAAIQWLDGHDTLIPRLFGLVAPGGVLAIQMPRNFDSPSHVGMREAARSGPWRAMLEPHLRENPVAPPAYYYDLLAKAGARLDIWEMEYLQELQGEDAVVEWTKGTALKPLLDALIEPERGQFLADYTARIRAAYPRHADGVTLFPFRRLYIVAAKAA